MEVDWGAAEFPMPHCFVGQRYVAPGWASATVISLGAIVGCVQLALTIVVPLAAAVVVTCAIALARRPPAPA